MSPRGGPGRGEEPQVGPGGRRGRAGGGGRRDGASHFLRPPGASAGAGGRTSRGAAGAEVGWPAGLGGSPGGGSQGDALPAAAGHRPGGPGFPRRYPRLCVVQAQGFFFPLWFSSLRAASPAARAPAVGVAVGLGLGLGRWGPGTARGAAAGRAGWGQWHLGRGDESNHLSGHVWAEGGLPSTPGFQGAKARGKAGPTDFAVTSPLESRRAGPGGPAAP